MNKVTEILQAARDDPTAAEHLLPLIYDELRRLASRRMGDERINHTLQPTALVHEAYIRLVGEQQSEQPQWEGRAHFFAAAAEAMSFLSSGFSATGPVRLADQENVSPFPVWPNPIRRSLLKNAERRGKISSSTPNNPPLGTVKTNSLPDAFALIFFAVLKMTM